MRGLRGGREALVDIVGRGEGEVWGGVYVLRVRFKRGDESNT